MLRATAMGRRGLLLCAMLAMGMVTAPEAQAQGVPGIGDAIRQAQPPAVPAPPAPVLPAIGGADTFLEPPMTAPANGPTIEVRRIEVVGNRVLPAAALQALVADGAGKSMTLEGLEALAERITRYYRARGYFVARAYVPAQDVTEGTIRIRVVEGNYGRFRLHNESHVIDPVVQGMLDDVKKYDIVSLDTLERAMLIINDTPGVQVARADVMPGERVGTSDFAIDTIAGPSVDGYAMLDNYGSVYTGRGRLSLGLNANSPTGHGDRLSLSGLVTDNRDLSTGRIGYSRVLSSSGTRGELAVSRTHYQLGDAYSALDALGTAKNVDLSLSYPVRRIRAQTLEVNFTAGFHDLVDDVRSVGAHTPKYERVAGAGANFRDEAALAGFDGTTMATANVAAGELSIDSTSARALDAAGARTNGGFFKLTAAASRASTLTPMTSLVLSAKAQQVLNGRSLDGSEKMGVSGYQGVQAYASGELVGDNAWLGQVQLQRSLGAVQSLALQGSLFAETAGVRAAHAPSAPGDRVLSDMGVGFDLNGRQGLLRIAIAHRVAAAAPLSEHEPRNRLLAQLGWIF